MEDIIGAVLTHAINDLHILSPELFASSLIITIRDSDAWPTDHLPTATGYSELSTNKEEGENALLLWLVHCCSMSFNFGSSATARFYQGKDEKDFCHLNVKYLIDERYIDRIGTKSL